MHKVIKNRLQVWLNRLGVGRLTENCKDDRVGNEIEMRERRSLLFDIADKRLLALLSLLEKVCEQFDQIFIAVTNGNDVANIIRVLHDCKPVLVNLRKCLGFVSYVFRDITAAEHSLQVNPH
jgi:hypothetical protein